MSRKTSQYLSILADGSVKEYQVGQVHIEAEGRRGFSWVMFGDDGDQSLFGLSALQSLRLIADTTHHRLIPAPPLRARPF